MSPFFSSNKLASVTPPVTPSQYTGPEAIAAALDSLDPEAMQAEAMADLKSGKKTYRDPAVKTLGILEGLKRNKLHPRDLILKRVPVLPVAFRPYTVQGDVFMPGDVNELYRDVIDVRNVYNKERQQFGDKVPERRLALYDAVKAVYGYGPPVTTKSTERGLSGFLTKVVGSGPKWSFTNRKLLSRTSDFVGRATAGVDPDLGMDEIGVPEKMAWKIYSAHVQRRLVKNGMSAPQALLAIRDQTPAARKELELEMKVRPVVYSRAPAWHKHSIMGGWAKLVPGDQIKANPFITLGSNLDFDGDQLGVHVPALPETVEEVKNKLMPSKMLFSIRDPEKVMQNPKHEQLLGLHTAQNRKAKLIHKVGSEKEALAKIKSGDISMSDEIELPDN